MSFAALAAVSKMKLASAAEKLIALAYADRHNEETGCAYPSVVWLGEFSSLNRKTVIAAVGRLERAGFLVDTGERRGTTKQIKVYRLHLDTVPVSVWSQKRDSTETGTVPKTVVEQSQKRDTDTVREPVSPKASPSSRAREPFPRPEWADPQVWADLLINRKRKSLSNTPTAHRKLLADIDRLVDDAWPPGRILEAAVGRGWGGIYGSVKDEDNGRRDGSAIGMGGNGRSRSASGFGRTIDAAQRAKALVAGRRRDH